MVAILMMSAKLVTLGLLKIKVYRSKGYDVIIYVHDVTTKISPVTSIAGVKPSLKIAFLEERRKKMRSSTTFQSPKNAVMFLIVINES